MSITVNLLKPNAKIDNAMTKNRLAWSIDAMMKAKARQLGVAPSQYLIDTVTVKACNRLDEGINALAIFFETRDEVEAMLLRQEKADSIIDQLIGLIRQTAEQNPMAKHQAI
ncbi:hypothetical protein QZJ86_12220 [Methylomonas montana]|uniref:hypothetical protein n=1 Tax=Methylomonas montana TaxID=3058963 RepID=UPI00265A0A64|nr:hypothetical protein [Methylomonas montana]WKJ88788.1 hypothetical protein QZJ86_12220 [Methylomonas montana]